MKKYKIECPNTDKHDKFKKILLIIEMGSDNKIGKLYYQCSDRNCRKWYGISINDLGGVTLTGMQLQNVGSSDPLIIHQLI